MTTVDCIRFHFFVSIYLRWKIKRKWRRFNALELFILLQLKLVNDETLWLAFAIPPRWLRILLILLNNSSSLRARCFPQTVFVTRPLNSATNNEGPFSFLRNSVIGWRIFKTKINPVFVYNHVFLIGFCNNFVKTSTCLTRTNITANSWITIRKRTAYATDGIL